MNKIDKIKQMYEHSQYYKDNMKMFKHDNGSIIGSDGNEDKLATFGSEQPLGEDGLLHVKEISKGYWFIWGHPSAFAVAEGETGLILIDNGDDDENSEVLARTISEKISSTKKIKHVIYSHAHYVWGEKGLSSVLDEDVKYYGHDKINKNIKETAGLGSNSPETAEAFFARAIKHVQALQPKEGAEYAQNGFAINMSASVSKTFHPVDVAFTKDEELTLDGVGIKIYYDQTADTDDNIDIIFTEPGILFSGLLWPTLFNVVTLRGSVYRDTKDMKRALLRYPTMDFKMALSVNGAPVRNREETLEEAEWMMSFLNYQEDQGYRGINNAWSVEDMIEKIPRMSSIDEGKFGRGEVYGNSKHYPAATAVNASGWFLGSINQLEPVFIGPDQKAFKYIETMGGLDKVKELTQQALKDEEFGFGFALAADLYRAYPEDEAVVALRMETIKQIAMRTKGSSERGFLWSEYLSLSGKHPLFQKPFTSVAQPEAIKTRTAVAGPVIDLVSNLKIRVNPTLAENKDWVVKLVMADTNEEVIIKTKDQVSRVMDKDFKADNAIEVQTTSVGFAAYYYGLATTETVFGENAKYFEIYDTFDAKTGTFIIK